MELAEQIKQRRIERGMSQEDLAERIYVSRQTISNWENDKTYPDVQSLLLLSVLFDTTVDELIKGDVKAMEEIVNSKETYKAMTRWTMGGLAVVVVAVAMLVVGYGILDWGFAPSFIIFFLIWGIGMAMLIQCERIKKRYDLVTYREILAFSKGETVDRDNPKSRRAREHRTVKAVAIMLVAAAIGAVIGWFTAPYIL